MTNNTVIAITHKYLMNLPVFVMKNSLNIITASVIIIIGISAKIVTFKYATLSNDSVIETSISKQSKDSKIPDEPPTLLAPDSALVI
jgi:hypothetical protein